MSSKQFSIPDIGPIVVQKHPTSKKISIKIRPGHLPKVTIPKLMTYHTGLSFAYEKKDWIKKHLLKLANEKPSLRIINEQTSIPSRLSHFSFSKNNGASISLNRYGNKVNISIPQNSSFEDPEIQEKLRQIIIAQLRSDAKKYFPVRVQFWADKFNFKFNKLAIKNAKTRWGSCSASNNINLNLHLMRLPEHLSDFIILHELCHTTHKNHGPNFHQLLNSLVGNEKKLDTELKAYHIAL